MQLLTSSQSRIYAYILSLVLHPDQADDILQKTNLVLWQKEDEFDLQGNFIAWSFRIAYYQVLAHRKHQQRDRLVFDDEMLNDLAEVASDVDETYECRQRLLRQCLDKLNGRQRDILHHRYQAGSTLQQIATDTHQEVNAVKQILFRTRHALIQCVNSGFAKEASQ